MGVRHLTQSLAQSKCSASRVICFIIIIVMANSAVLDPQPQSRRMKVQERCGSVHLSHLPPPTGSGVNLRFKALGLSLAGPCGCSGSKVVELGDQPIGRLI